MNRIEAGKMVAEALEQRRKFGKHFGVRDMPPEFLDALVIEVERLQALAGRAEDPEQGLKALQETCAALEAQLKEQHDEIVLLKRQLGAAKSRETQLRKQLAEVVKQTEV